MLLAMLALGVVSEAAGAAPPPESPGPSMRWGPYKDASLNATDARVLAPGATLTLAFATGKCGSETMAGLPAQAWARANLALLEAAGVDFVVSTGGQAGKFACASAEGMERFLAHFRSPRLIGIDFDIEGERTADELDALTHQIAASQARHPRLRWSLTLPTFAGSDASRAGLNPLAATVLAAARNNGVRDFIVNLMVMDYGVPSPAVCVSTGRACDMARSAVQAAENLHAGFGVPYARIALTAMIGRNDTDGSATTLDDMSAMARYVRERGLAGLHYWSLDRDNPCPDHVPRSDCSGMPYPPLAFTRAIESALRAAPSPAADRR